MILKLDTLLELRDEEQITNKCLFQTSSFNKAIQRIRYNSLLPEWDKDLIQEIKQKTENICRAIHRRQNEGKFMNQHSVVTCLMNREIGIHNNYSSLIAWQLMKLDMPMFHEDKQYFVVDCIVHLLSDNTIGNIALNVVKKWLSSYEVGELPLTYLVRSLVHHHQLSNLPVGIHPYLENLRTLLETIDEFEYQSCYAKKGKLPKRKSYTTESLQKAVNDVKHNNMSLRKSSMKYGVPVMTIHDHIAGKVDDGAKPGRPTVLSFEVERKIVEKIKNAAKQGFGITRRLLKVKIARLIRSNKISTPFKNGIPGKDWLSGFLSRHQDLSLRSPLALQTVRSKMLNPVKVNAYFRDLESFLVNLGIQDIPSRIWNMDETSVPLTHKPERVLAETGSKNIPGRVGDCRESLSVLGCINAAGQNIPPMVIVRGKTSKSLNAFNVSEGVPDTKYTYQERAWMEDVLSETWFRDHF
ncbi:unnamed protein product [Mytilus edulis]|uniref:Transposase n=1 Tax=Mytilus edulis TaxID=6550 RepID=A0A8S3V481_MYTED|nr:unnamed protein product [Mytilus edulis]